MYEYFRSRELADPEQCLVLVSDMQTRLLAPLADRDTLLRRCELFLEGAALLEVPILGTEQYPVGLGRTVESVAPFLPNPVEKLRFSAIEAVELPPVGERSDERFRLVIVGIETHVCVLQSALDAQSLGYDVYLPSDLLTSQRRFEHDSALRRLENAGMKVTTAQSLLFEWCQTAGDSRFRSLSAIAKQLNAIP